MGFDALMPTYEYVCGECAAKRIAYRTTDERDRVTECEACGVPMRRSYRIGGISFKGSGWGKD